jgi:ABC-type sugar transport system ATPase subunit
LRKIYFCGSCPIEAGGSGATDLLMPRIEALQKVGLAELDSGTLVRQSGIGQKQLVEIAAGLSHRCRVLILDEPTAALTVTDTERFFVQIRKLQQTEIDKDIGKSRRSRRRLL